MSIQAITWVLEEAPDVPPHLVAVLVSLAWHSDDNGRGSYPAQATIAKHARKTDRAVRNDLDALVERGLIRRGDQSLVAHIPADRRPTVYDLSMRAEKGANDRKHSSGRKQGSGRKPSTERPEAQFRTDRKPTSYNPSEEPSVKELPPPTAGAESAQTLIGEWIDHCTRRPPGAVIGQVSKHTKALLDEGFTIAEVRQGLAAWHQKGLHPATLPSVVHEVINAAGRPAAPTRTPPSTTDQRVAAAQSLKAKFANRPHLEIAR